MKVDCRTCKFFIPRNEMYPDEIEKALKWIEAHRPGKYLLGWCERFERPVTYYRGTCFGWTPNEVKQLSLMKFLQQ